MKSVVSVRPAAPPPSPPRPPPPSLPARLAAAALAALAVTLTPPLAAPPPAAALLNSPNARLPRTADAALRRAIPALNPDVRRAQDLLEGVAFKLRIPQRKPWSAMSADVAAASAILDDPAIVRAGTPPSALPEAQAHAAAAVAGLVRVQAAIDAQDPGVTAARLAATLADVAALEVAQAPGLPFALPRDLGSGAYPILTGRAAVALEIVRPRGGNGNDGEGLTPSVRPGEDPATPLARPDGTAARRAGGAAADTATLVLTLDGYSAPLTAGALAANVAAGLYDGLPLTAGPTSVLAGGGIPADRIPGRHATLPLELLPAGSFDPVYRSPLDVGGGELPVLPLSVYGAVAMARPASVPDGEVSATEFFLFLYSRAQSGLSGLSFEEGEFPVCGYVTEGGDVLPRLRSGDVIRKARLVEGADRLVLPREVKAGGE
jgi:cyclophilin family peptidyl-prolyl cis-trans isomerase